MPPGYNAVYLHLLKEHHAALTSSSSLAAPHYALAIQSLTRCPVPMESVAALDVLEGFSAGVRRRLNDMIESAGGIEKVKETIVEDRRRKRARRSLVQELDEMEAQEEQIANQASDMRPSSESSAHAKAKSQASRSQSLGDVQATMTGSASGSGSKRAVSNNAEEEEVASAKRCSSRHTSVYMPTPRSGAWGILMALYLLSVDQLDTTVPDETTYHTKEAIISKGQKYCRASYTYTVSRKAGGGSSSSGGGAKYLTAWSAVKTLLNRGMAYQKGRPATFGLSSEGIRIAKEIAVKEGKQVEEERNKETGSERRDGTCEDSTSSSTSARRSALLEQLEALDSEPPITSDKGKPQKQRPKSADHLSRQPTNTPRLQKSKSAHHHGTESSFEDSNHDGSSASEKQDLSTISRSDMTSSRPPLVAVNNRIARSAFTPLNLPPKTKPTTPITALYLPTKERSTMGSTLKIPPRTLPYQRQSESHSRGHSGMGSSPGHVEVIVLDDD